MQDLGAAYYALGDKQSFPIRCPLEFPHILQTLRSDDLRRLAAQGANLDGPFWASGSSNPRTVGRNIPEQIIRTGIVVRIQVKASDFKPAPFDRIEGREDHLFAVFALFGYRA